MVKTMDYLDKMKRLVAGTLCATALSACGGKEQGVDQPKEQVIRTPAHRMPGDKLYSVFKDPSKASGHIIMRYSTDSVAEMLKQDVDRQGLDAKLTAQFLLVTDKDHDRTITPYEAGLQDRDGQVLFTLVYRGQDDHRPFGVRYEDVETITQVGKAFGKSGLPKARLISFLKTYDKNDDGLISRTEAGLNRGDKK